MRGMFPCGERGLHTQHAPAPAPVFSRRLMGGFDDIQNGLHEPAALLAKYYVRILLEWGYSVQNDILAMFY